VRTMNMAVKDVMTTQVFWVERDTPFSAIAAALRHQRVSAFPVLDEESRVIGVVSESGLLNKMALGGGEDYMPGMITIRTGVLSTEGAANPGAFDIAVTEPDVFDVLARFPID
jgi:predicted transcriptional regulator